MATSNTPVSPRLLAGGNPQIPKGEGDAPVQAWIAAVPGWKQEAARQLDALVVKAVPNLRKAVKWNSPLYAVEGKEGWFLSMHCYARYIKVAFFRGASLDPMPPESSKSQDTRYLHVFEDIPLDTAQFTRWVKQASRLPGERM
ncbi:DUF1801 domain-containing protein [Stenotrophomonas sp.]|uniref:DUF1801 domain-containing protein n=1 Tax=Stenotrophomonas sp. TaxID=69392 RepID=UPI00289996F9|nr:DUF1801 domain-containing protein [Stenotrophomonas sp.]